MKKLTYGSFGIFLLVLLLFSACGGASEEDTKAADVQQLDVVQDGVDIVIKDQFADIPTPTELPTVTTAPAPAGDSVSADTISQNSLSENVLTLYASSRSGTNVRAGAGSDSELLGTIPYGESVQATGIADNGWYEIAYGDDGKPGYVHPAYVSLTELTDIEAQAEDGEGAEVESGAAAEDAVEAAADAAVAPSPAVAPAPAVPAAGILMIGDSRCVQMRDATGGGGVSWICENGKGYDWFVETAVPQADAIVGRGTKVVICLGVNDTDHGYSYAALVNQLAANWAARGAKTYYVSVNPVSDNPWTDMDSVLNINKVLQSNLAVPYIDTCSWLLNNGYTMVDGMHFDTATNINVFNLIIGSVR